MSSHAPNPANPYLPPTHVRVRVRWETFLIAGVVLALASVGVLMLVYGGATNPASALTTRPTTSPATTADAAADATDPATDAAATPDDALSLDDSRGLLEEARSLALDARWDEAADRLDSITDPTIRTTLAIDAESTRLAAARDRWTQLGLLLDSQVARSEWKEADATLAKLAAIAHLDDAKLETQALVHGALTGKPTPAVTPAPAPVTTAKPAPATASKPAATAAPGSPKPQAAAPAHTAAPATAKPTAAKPAAHAATTNGNAADTGVAAATPGVGTAAAIVGDIDPAALNGLINQGLATLPAA